MEQAWKFFSSPHNLTLITPPDMDFHIKSRNLPEEIHDGVMIEYRVRPVMRIPAKWISEITNVLPPFKFTDRQISGPYRLWEHEHTLEETENGVMVTDEIRYALPFGFLGVIAHNLFVKKRLQSIFEYRRKALKKMFG